MAQEFTMGAGGVPAGTYSQAEFLGAEDYENQYGKALRLRWRILGGEHDGQEAGRICSPSLSQKSALGKLAVCLKGGPIAIGERFRFADFVGARGGLIVEQTQGGGSRVAAFFRHGGNGQATQQPQAVAPPPPPPPAATPQAQPQPVAASPPWESPQATPTAAELEAFRQWQATQKQAAERF